MSCTNDTRTPLELGAEILRLLEPAWRLAETLEDFGGWDDEDVIRRRLVLVRAALLREGDLVLVERRMLATGPR